MDFSTREFILSMPARYLFRQSRDVHPSLSKAVAPSRAARGYQLSTYPRCFYSPGFFYGAVFFVLCLLSAVTAATSIKANNTTNLNVAGSWDVLPGTGDIAQWKNPPLSAANATVLGADLSWLGISILTPGGTVTISAGNTLTLGTSGIDMSSAGNDLAINSAIALGGNQTWNAGGQVLAIGGTVANTSFIDNTLTVSGSGSTLFSGAITGAQSALFSDDFSDNSL